MNEEAFRALEKCLDFCQGEIVEDFLTPAWRELAAARKLLAAAEKWKTGHASATELIEALTACRASAETGKNQNA